MNQVNIKVETGYFKYPNVVATFDGTNIGRFFSDSYLRDSIWDAIVDAKDDKDIYDFANFVFSGVNNAVKRHYTGQNLMLLSIDAIDDSGNLSITIVR